MKILLNHLLWRSVLLNLQCGDRYKGILVATLFIVAVTALCSLN